DPRQILDAPVEHARIDPDNVEILVQHLKCAAFELPFEEGDRFGDLPAEGLADALGFLADHGVVHPAPNAQGTLVHHWATEGYPANHVSLRSVSWDNFVVVDLDTDKTIAEMDWRSTHVMLHVQAIYQHAGAQYQVERLDFDNHKAFVRRVKPDYYTTAITHTKVTVVEEEDGAALATPGLVSASLASMGLASAASDAALATGAELGGASPGPRLAAGLGEVSVVQKVVGYKKIKFHTHENVGYGDVRLPEMQMHTSAFWLTWPEELVLRCAETRGVPRATIIDGLRGLLATLRVVAATGLMVDPRDVGTTVGDQSTEGAPPSSGGGGFDPTLFLYDAVPGGIGLAPRLFDEREGLLRRARSLIERCACARGCPACIGPDAGLPADIPGLQRTPRKALVLGLLDDAGWTTAH
ncbi:MAG: Zn-binding domain-containing protein, partial [Myxococcota bacterium]